jgi:NADPH2:quinone reductase
MKAIQVHQHGGPEVLIYEDIPDPQPQAGQAVVRTEAIGVNFIDVYHRTGLYHVEPPLVPGSEAAGVVTAVGEGVREVKVGDRVAYAMSRGSYAELQAVDAWKLVVLPENVDARAGAAIMLQGLTAHYLCYSTFPIKSNHAALVHAAAGGVGLLLTQLLKKRGAAVYATVSTPEKAALAKEAGADEVILYTEQDFEQEIQRITGGSGVDVAYDSVGQTTFQGSLNCLRPRGYMVSYGQSSGPVEGFKVADLGPKALFLTRPSMANYCANREELYSRTNDLFRWYRAGDLKLRIERTFPLSEAADAHRALEGRQTTGKLLLLPSPPEASINAD